MMPLGVSKPHPWRRDNGETITVVAFHRLKANNAGHPEADNYMNVPLVNLHWEGLVFIFAPPKDALLVCQIIPKLGLISLLTLSAFIVRSQHQNHTIWWWAFSHYQLWDSSFLCRTGSVSSVRLSGARIWSRRPTQCQHDMCILPCQDSRSLSDCIFWTRITPEPTSAAYWARLRHHAEWLPT